MKLNPININFGKKLVATCEVRTSPSKKCCAAIYKFDPKDEQDVSDIKNSEYTTSIKNSFIRQSNSKHPNAFEYYAICDNSTDEIIACAKLSQHCSQKENRKEFYTSIDELETNSHYIDPITPMLGYIAYYAYKHYSNSIKMPAGTYPMSEMKKCGFKTESENFTIRAKGFNERMTRAYYRNYLEFVV